MSSTAAFRAAPSLPVMLRRQVRRGTSAPVLDPSQQRVAEHRGGPLRVLGAPGTGKTTALVEAVVSRVEHDGRDRQDGRDRRDRRDRRDGVDAGQVLLLAPTRLAAARLREAVTARLGRTVSEPLARTPASLAFSVLRQLAAAAGEPPPRLIAGPEQDLVLRELLAGHQAGEGSAPAWPADVRAALHTRGFRAQLRDLLMRAIERGVDPVDLARLGQQQGRPEWVAAAQVLDEYLGVTGLATPGAYDAASIASTATAALNDDDVLLREVRAKARFIAVDDAHELTAAAADLVLTIAGQGGQLLLVGDPDAATQGFRGADPALLVGTDDPMAAAGSRVPTVLLTRSWRQGPALRAVSRRVADRIGVHGGHAHRSVEHHGSGVDGSPEHTAATGRAEVHVLRSTGHEAAFVAALLRRQHLEHDVAWSDMAVVVRSGSRAATLRRVLAAADVPVEVPAAQAPVRDQRAVVPLLDAFEVVLGLAATDDTAEPARAAAEALTPTLAVDLLTSPLGGADAVALRRLRRALRAEEIAGGGGRASDELLVAALLDPALLATIEPATTAPARRVARVLAAGREALGVGGAAGSAASAESVLWALWQASRLADEWRRTALAGGPSGARADRDLDAVVALFDAAARFTDRLPRASAGAFLDHLRGSEVAGDTLAERGSDGDAVALTTPAGAAGLGWRVVVVCGVQEGVWPDLRARGSLLGAHDLVDVLTGRSTDPRAALRAVRDDETRLFHVAVSRASELLVVTAARDDDQQPSDLMDLVDPAPGVSFDDEEQRALTPVPRPLSLPGLVARLRQAVTDPLASTDPDRAAEAAAAATCLAQLAEAGVRGADPADWYGLAPLTDEGALRLPGPVRVSPSRVEEFERCSLRWLLTSAGGRSASSVAQGLGNLVHEIAADLPDADADALTAELHRRWARLGLGTGWAADTERKRLEQMIGKLGAYLAAERATWALVDAEQDFAAEVDTPDGQVLLSGRVDRLERDPAGRLRVVDLKTGKSAPTGNDVLQHGQLGVYQVAVEHGAFTDGEPATSGGAALVHLGVPTVRPKVQHQPPLAEAGDPDWAIALLARVGAGMAGAAFPATVNDMCTPCSVRSCCPAVGEGRQVTA